MSSSLLEEARCPLQVRKLDRRLTVASLDVYEGRQGAKTFMRGSVMGKSRCVLSTVRYEWQMTESKGDALAELQGFITPCLCVDSVEDDCLDRNRNSPNGTLVFR